MVRFLVGSKAGGGTPGCIGASRWLCLLAAFAAAQPAARADSWMQAPGGSIDLRSRQWQNINPGMSTDAYRDASRRNRRLLVQRLEDAAVSLGASETATNVLGAVIGLAAGNPEISLNRSKTLSLQLNDATDNDRSVFFKVGFDW